MRALARWGIAPLLATPLGAWALGLGDIELHSALNQPFQAKIALVATAEELQGLKVALASPDTFKRYGLDRPGYLSRLEFRVDSARTGQATIDVSSRESIAEPFVTLLVEATWARGRRLREYTVLLDPPVLLPAPAVAPAVQPAQTRPADSSSGGAINRPPQPTEAPRPQPAPVQPPTSNNAPAPAPRTPAAPGGSYGPVQRAETLWAIADRFRSDGVSMNQMMVAIYRANPQAFAGNMNVLLVGSTLRMPESSDLQDLAVTVANGEVQRQTEEWQNRPQQGRLRLVPTETAVASRGPGSPAPAQPTPVPAPAVPAPAAPVNRPPANAVPPAVPAPGGDVNVDSGRPLAVQNPTLQNLQQQAANQNSPQPPQAVPAAGEPPVAAPGVDLDDQVFKQPEAAAPAEAPAAPAAAPAPTPSGPSLTAQILAWVMSPALWIGLGVAALLFTALWFVRRKRQEPEDVTGRWEALESEVDDPEAREATERMRRQLPDESIVVEESAQPRRADAKEPSDDARGRTSRAPRAAAPPADETLSSQTVINLDQADPVAEADFHMAYGLYDQAAELVQKALEAAPNRRDLKLKLLEVFFVWGNKDAFLSAAQSLRKELGQRPDADWDKVVIMGKQICPDERLFAEATSAAGQVDVDLEAGGDAPLDLAFDEASAGGMDIDIGDAGGLDFDLDSSGARRQQPPPPRAMPRAGKKAESEDDLLDIGERTAAGLEAALFAPSADDDADEDTGRRTTPDLAADESLEVTQESPTIESPRGGRGDWAQVSLDSATQEFALDAPTVETPTIESPSPDAPTIETPTIETRRGNEPPTTEQPGLSISDRTAEIQLDDLGLDIKDLEGLPTDLGDLPVAQSSETDTRQQPVLSSDDDELLSATGVTQVLRGEDDDEGLDQRKTSVLGDEDATMLAPGYGDDNTMTGTEVLDQRFEFDDQSGDTSLVKSLRQEDNLDLNLDDLSAALQGADTVEQPRSKTFSNDVFGGGDTPLDLDVGDDVLGGDDPTGTEEASPLDPQTMTEVGTKLDLARAYIDMGDPEGARSILEEVLDEGDPNQRREAQGLIDVLSA